MEKTWYIGGQNQGGRLMLERELDSSFVPQGFVNTLWSYKKINNYFFARHAQPRSQTPMGTW